MDAMGITIFTLCMAIFWTGVFLKALPLLRDHMRVYPLIFLLALCMIRILLPLEFPFTMVINSRKILPAVQSFFCAPFAHFFHTDVTLYRCLMAIWIVGAAVSAIRHAAGRFRFRRTVSLLPVSDEKRLYDILKETGIKGAENIPIKVSSAFSSPAILGCRRPVLLLPDIPFSRGQLLGIFIHELSHYRKRHYVMKAFAELIHLIFWWNPLFSDLSGEVSHALEMHADRLVCDRLDTDQRMEYLMGILKTLENGRDKKTTPESAYCLKLAEKEDRKMLRQRFQMVLEYNCKSNGKYALIIFPLICALFLLSYGVVLQPYSMPERENYLLESDCYFLVDMKNGYDLYYSSGEYFFHIKENNIQNSDFQNLPIYHNLEEALQ